MDGLDISMEPFSEENAFVQNAILYCTNEYFLIIMTNVLLKSHLCLLHYDTVKCQTSKTSNTDFIKTSAVGVYPIHISAQMHVHVAVE